MPVQRSLLRAIAYGLTAITCVLSLLSHESVAEDLAIRIVTPVPFQVIQRVGFDPATALAAVPGSAAYGAAEVVVSGTLPEETKCFWLQGSPTRPTRMRHGCKFPTRPGASLRMISPGPHGLWQMIRNRLRMAATAVRSGHRSETPCLTNCTCRSDLQTSPSAEHRLRNGCRVVSFTRG